MIEFYNVKKKKKVQIDESKVTKQAMERTTKTGKTLFAMHFEPLMMTELS